ncbi:MAG: ABC transporter ATP-binding protein [Planctomycetes bacterium]|nr:ABC transporter ATP-binding protein [Planctomycetota bacterium]
MGDMEVAALQGVSLDVAAGEFVAVMGSSGSGKSTLMAILGGLDRPTAGTYELDGADVAGLSRDALARLRNAKIGFVFQSFNLLARTTALENVELPLMYARGVSGSERRKRARESLERVGLASREGHRPNQLSGGQQQRVAIARALVNRPSLVLADEPTGNLDSRVTAEIMALFQELNDAGITIVFVTHEPDVAQYAKRKVVMRDGRIVTDEPVRDRTVATAVASAVVSAVASAVVSASAPGADAAGVAP